MNQQPSLVYDLIIHLIPALIAGLGAYFGVKYAIRDHANRLDMILQRQMWVVRKMIALATTHNSNHPDSPPINVDDFPVDMGGAFRV